VVSLSTATLVRLGASCGTPLLISQPFDDFLIIRIDRSRDNRTDQDSPLTRTPDPPGAAKSNHQDTLKSHFPSYFQLNQTKKPN